MDLYISLIYFVSTRVYICTLLPRTSELWNRQTPDVIPLRYNTGFLKKQALKYWQRLGSSGVADEHLSSNGLSALFPPIWYKKEEKKCFKDI